MWNWLPNTLGMYCDLQLKSTFTANNSFKIPLEIKATLRWCRHFAFQIVSFSVWTASSPLPVFRKLLFVSLGGRRDPTSHNTEMDISCAGPWQSYDLGSTQWVPFQALNLEWVTQRPRIHRGYSQKQQGWLQRESAPQHSNGARLRWGQGKTSTTVPVSFLSLGFQPSSNYFVLSKSEYCSLQLRALTHTMREMFSHEK